MKKSWLSLVAIGSLAILTTGCGGEGSKPAATPTPSPSAAATPAATAPATPAPSAAVPPTTPTAATPAKPAVAASNPTVPGKPVSVDVAVGLIPATNGESWAKTVSKGRPDPFALLALKPTEVIEKDPLTQQPIPRKVRSRVAANSDAPGGDSGSRIPAAKSGIDKPLPKIRVAVNPDSGADADKPKATGKSKVAALPAKDAAKKSAKAIGGDKPSKSAKSPVPGKVAAKGGVLRPVSSDVAPGKIPGAVAARTEQPAAKPLQAMAVEIFGTIEVAGKTQVVVKLPNENFSRYIEVGDRINGTQVLVKRVEGANSLNPIIVLEEVGVEVPRKIGDNKPTAPATAAQPQAQPPAK